MPNRIYSIRNIGSFMSRDIEVLVVEDSKTEAMLLKLLLNENGYHVLMASNGKEAYALAKERKPSIIVSDVIMPVMNGYELCHAVKSDKALTGIPFVLLTTLSNLEDIIIGLNARADVFITKPYDDEYLLSKVEMLLTTSVSQKIKDHSAEIVINSKKHIISSGRQQILDFLLSVYENAICQYRILVNTQLDLENAIKNQENQFLEITASEERFRSLVRTIPDIVYRTDLNGKFTLFW